MYVDTLVNPSDPFCQSLLKKLYSFDDIKVAHGISQQFFLWTRVLKHNKYLGITQAIFQSKHKIMFLPLIALLIEFFVYQGDPRHLQGSCIVYIFVYIN